VLQKKQTTMGDRETQQRIYGYRMLKLLALQAGSDHRETERMLSEYSQAGAGEILDLTFVDLELEALSPTDALEAFDRASEQFYLVSNREDRKAFLLEALRIVRADDHLNLQENIMISRLFTAWLS
jgi:hypothetical protein